MPYLKSLFSLGLDALFATCVIVLIAKFTQEGGHDLVVPILVGCVAVVLYGLVVSVIQRYKYSEYIQSAHQIDRLVKHLAARGVEALVHHQGDGTITWLLIVPTEPVFMNRQRWALAICEAPHDGLSPDGQFIGVNMFTRYKRTENVGRSNDAFVFDLNTRSVTKKFETPRMSIVQALKVVRSGLQYADIGDLTQLRASLVDWNVFER